MKKAAGALMPLLAGISAAFIFLAFYAIHGFYPFGERSVVWCDMDQQYVPLLMELKTAWGEGSLFLGRGGGLMNFYGVFLFFVSSPMSLITLAVDNSGMFWFVNILLVIKIFLCSVSAGVYFRRVIPRLSSVFSLIMSVMYGLSGYVMMYYQNDMWLDMMIVFPLLLVSLFRLIDSGKWALYIICTVMCMLLSFYISFMVVAFLVMAGGAALCLCCEPSKRADRAVRLIICDICAALLSGAVWLPAFMQYTSSGRGNSLLSIYFGGSFVDGFFDKAALLSGSCLAVGGAVLAVLLRKRLCSGKAVLFSAGSVISLVGAFIEPTNKLLHIGSYQAYPFRYGFIVILLGFSTCGELLAAPGKAAPRKSSYITAGIAAAVFAAVSAAAYVERSSLSSYVQSLSVDAGSGLPLAGFCLLGAAVYILCVRSFTLGHTGHTFTACIMGAAMLCEVLVSFGVNVAEVCDSTALFKRTCEAFEQIPDDGFVRVKAGRNYYYPNYAEGFGKYSLGHYTSLTDCDFLYAMKRLGYSSYWLDTSSVGGTLLTDEFLLNKYMIGRSCGNCKAYEVCSRKGELTVYRDPHVLGGGLVSDVSPQELEDFGAYERVESANFIAERLFGSSTPAVKLSPDTLTGAEITENDGMTYVKRLDKADTSIGYSIYAEGRKELYFDLFGRYSTDLYEEYYGAVEVYVNGVLVQSNYPSSACSGILDLGTYADEKVNVTVKVIKDFEASSFGLWLYDLGISETAADSAHTAPVEVRGRTLTAKADRGGYLYLPVAWSGGWSCTVNGEPSRVIRTLGALAAVELAEGGACVKLSFLPKGMKAGAGLTTAGAVMFLLLFIFLKGEKNTGVIGRAAEKALYIIGSVTVLLCFIAAPVIWAAVNLISQVVGG